MSAPQYNKMYIVVNNSLKMGKGKIAGQVGHGVSHVIRFLERKSIDHKDRYKKWLKDGMEAKIVLQGSESQLEDLLNAHCISKNPSDEVYCFAIRDAGKTQIPAGSLTVVAFIPLEEETVPIEVKGLKLL